MKLSAVVINYNTKQLLARCLESLEGWDDVIVVDNASSDGSAEMVAQRFGRVKLVRCRSNAGFGAGANAGAAQAQGDVVVFFNPDTWVTPDVPRRLAEFLAATPRAGVVGCGLYDEDGRRLVSARRFYDTRSLIARRIAPGIRAVRDFEMLDYETRDARPSGWVAGTGMAVRKELFDRLGGFDERFFLYFEDVDLCLRTWLEGYQVWYLPRARVYHYQRRESAKPGRAFVYHLASAAKYWRKWNGFDGAQPAFRDTISPFDASFVERSERPRLTNEKTPEAPKVRSSAQISALRTASRRRPLEVVVEARALLGHLTGVGRSLESLVYAMSERDDVSVTLLATSLRGTRGVHRYRLFARTRALRVPARLVDASWSTSRGLPVEALVGRCDVVHGPNFVLPAAVRAARVVTVHDLGFLRFPSLHDPRRRSIGIHLESWVRNADRVITVSEFTKKELLQLMDVDPSKIDVVYNGVRRLPSDGPPPSTPLPERFVLYVGTVELRKGAEILFEAYRLARLAVGASLPPLVIAGDLGMGAEDALRAAVRRGLEEERIVLLERPSDTVLGYLYPRASLFVFPSLYEGFGMPPLEAMAHGVPTVATGCGALSEVLGTAAVLVGPPPELKDLGGATGVTVSDESKRSLAESFARAMSATLEDGASRERLSAAGRDRASMYTWERAAAETVNTYHRAIEARSL